MLISLMLLGCVAEDKAQATMQDEIQGYQVQLDGAWIKDATLVDSNGQIAVYKGNGLYVFKNKPQGTLLLTGGQFEKTGVDNNMTLRADANATRLSKLDSFFYQYPHLKNTLLSAIDAKDANMQRNNRIGTEKIVYLMASNNLLDEFSSSLQGVQSYNDVLRSARSASAQSGNAEALNVSLLMIGLSFFDVSDESHINKFDANPRILSISPSSTTKIGSASNKRPTITLIFSEKVDYVNTANVTFTKTGSTTNLVSVSGAVSSYTLTPNVDLESGVSYTLTLKSGIKDAVGNALSQVTKNYTAARFSGADTTAPTLSSTSPNSNTPIGSASNKRPAITLNFSENVININDNNVTFEENGDPVAFSISGSGSSYTITPSRDLASDENYTLTLKSGITDAAGNALAQIIKTYTVRAFRRYVKTTSAGAGNGKSWASAYAGANLQQAINDVAAAKGEVWIASGIYKPSTNDPSVSFELKDGVKIYGSFAGTETSTTARNISANSTTFSGDMDNNDITNSDPTDGSYLGIKGSNSETLIKVSNASDNNTLIDGIYIVGGSSNTNGGGLVVQSSKLKLKNVYFRGNQSTGKGGAIYLKGGSNLNIDYTSGGTSGPGTPISSTFGSNKADEGGAIYNDQSSLILKSSVVNKSVNFEDNKADNGGAIYNNNVDVSPTANVEISNVNFKNNKVSKGGGAIYNDDSNITITNAAFLNNEALQSGGAIFNDGSSNTLNRITFSGNRVQRDDGIAAGTGGAIHNENNSNSTITNATFSYNTNFTNNTSSSTAKAKGGAVYNHNSAPVFINTTFNHNHAYKGGAMFTESNATKPMFVNALMWDNTGDPSNGNPVYEQYFPQGNQAGANFAHAGSTYMPTSNSAPSDPNLVRKQNPANVNGVKHEYYEIGSSISAGLAVGSHTTNNGVTVTVPNKDQIGNSRPRPNQTDCSNGVCPGAIQVVDTNGSKVDYAFIKYFKNKSTSVGTATILVVFSEDIKGSSMNSSNIEVEAKDGTGNVTSVTPTASVSAGMSAPTNKYEVEFPTNLGSRYTVKFKESIQSSGSAPLNREYIYEYEP